jgi:hypothetical protein
VVGSLGGCSMLDNAILPQITIGFRHQGTPTDIAALRSRMPGE